MAKLYTNENFPLQVVRGLRTLGHDVLTSVEARQANRRVPDEDVLTFATSQQRALLTQNRRDFLRIHNSGSVDHSGLVLCTADPDFDGQARRIHEAVCSLGAGLHGTLVRVNRPAS